MSNNGLLASTDVCATGDPNSNFFLRKGVAISVPSPLEVISPDGSQITTISTANNGDSAIVTTAGLFLNLGTNNDLFVNTAPTTGGDTHGIIISRNGTVPASVKVDNIGVMRLQTAVGNVSVMSPDSTKAGSIQEDNTGIMTLSTLTSVALVPGNGTITLGNGTTVGGAVVSVNGASGLGRVYDTVYNIPPIPSVFSEIFTWTTDMTNGQNLTTFTLPASGLYMLYTYIDLASATLATNSVNNYFTNFMLYGDPAHSALIAPGTQSQIASFSMAKDISTNFGNVSTSIIMPLSNNTYEPNQRYKFAKSQAGGYTGGGVTLVLYRLA